MKKTKTIRTIAFIAVAIFLAYQSVYFRKLSVVKSGTGNSFDPAAYAKGIWESKMPGKIDSAISLPDLMQAITNNPDSGFEELTNALAIGNYRYALVKLTGTVKQVGEDDCLISTQVADSALDLKLATEFIFGNAIRDASGLVSVLDFPNTDNLNGISESLNKIVRTAIVPPFRKNVKVGDKLSMVGALETNMAHIHWQGAEIIPVRLQIIN